VSDSIIWITGATSGIGEAMAATVPYPDARVINASRRPHPVLESIHLDLADPATWSRLTDHFISELATFTGTRAILVHNAFVAPPVGFSGEVDAHEYQAHAVGNAAAPLVLGDAFLRAVRTCGRRDLQAGVVMMSSAAARVPFAGQSGYGAGKAAMEQWVRTVRSELAHRGSSTWVVAVRPGAIDTPSLRVAAAADPHDFPTAAGAQQALAAGLVDSPEVAALRIWDVLPPGPDTPAVVLLGEMLAPPRAEG